MSSTDKPRYHCHRAILKVSINKGMQLYRAMLSAWQLNSTTTVPSLPPLGSLPLLSVHSTYLPNTFPPSLHANFHIIPCFCSAPHFRISSSTTPFFCVFYVFCVFCTIDPTAMPVLRIAHTRAHACRLGDLAAARNQAVEDVDKEEICFLGEGDEAGGAEGRHCCEDGMSEILRRVFGGI